MFLNAPPEERLEPRTERYEPAPRTNYFSLIGSVCLDFCVVVNRHDILFGEVYDRFIAATKVWTVLCTRFVWFGFRPVNRSALDQTHIFLELLEPYVLNDKLTSLPPTVMKAFVEHYISTGQAAAVERCLLHLNARTMDLDLTIRLCLQYNLFSALVYVLNNGTNDYTTPVDILLVYSLDIKAGLMKSLMKRAAQVPADMMTPSLAGDGTMTMRLVGTPDDRKSLGLKLLLYIQVRYCSSLLSLAVAFP
jgi:Golgi CORVET complex core vacuolar protein 8